MNALPSTLKWLGSGLGLWAAMACSAEASAPPSPSGTGSTQAQGGSNNGSGGSGTALPTAGTTGSLPTAGTSATGQGGSTAVGTAGTTGVGTAGTAAGGMSGGALTSCPVPPAAGTMTDLLIDDLEDGDNGVKRIGGRSGFWYTYGDALGSTIVPKPDPGGTGAPLVPGSTMCHGGMKCIAISGTTVAGDPTANMYAYAGVGFDFSNAKKPCVYNASAYTGIKFWARGDVPITIKLNTTANSTPDGGGTCSGTTCNGGFSPTGADEVLTPTWTEFTIPFATAMGPTWVIPAIALDKATLLTLQFQVPPGQTFSIAIDDVTFY